MIKTAATWLWTNTPWYVKGIFAIIVIPNFVFNAIIFFVWFLPWHTQTIQASSITTSDKIESQILHSIEKQTIINQNMNDNILRMERHQSLFMSAVLNNNSRQNKNEP